MTPEARRDVVIAVVLVVVGGAILAGATSIPPGVQTDPLGPRVFPAALGAGIVVCGALLAIAALFFHGRTGGAGLILEAGPEDGEDEGAGPFSPGRLAGAIAATAAYLVIFDPLGYLLATPPYVGAILAIHGGASRLARITAPVFVTAALYAAFRIGLGIPVPTGVLQSVLPW